jgi:hypothetical protein
MRNIVWLSVFSFIFSFSSCITPSVESNNKATQSPVPVIGNMATFNPSTDTPKYTVEEILDIAKKHSPDCRIKTGIQNISGCRCSAIDLYEEVAPSYVAKYTGKGIWLVSKTCSINSAFSRNWYFYEDSAELVIRND